MLPCLTYTYTHVNHIQGRQYVLGRGNWSPPIFGKFFQFSVFFSIFFKIAQKKKFEKKNSIWVASILGDTAKDPLQNLFQDGGGPDNANKINK